MDGEIGKEAPKYQTSELGTHFECPAHLRIQTDLSLDIICLQLKEMITQLNRGNLQNYETY